MKIFKSTGKSLSEALIFASTNPQYDDRLFIELQVQYMKIPSSNLGRTCCVQKLFLTFRTISVHNMFSPCSAKRRASDKDLLVQVITQFHNAKFSAITYSLTKSCNFKIFLTISPSTFLLKRCTFLSLYHTELPNEVYILPFPVFQKKYILYK